MGEKISAKQMATIIAYESTNAIAVGAAAALFLSLTALSPLVVGAIIGCSSLILRESKYGGSVLLQENYYVGGSVKGICRSSIFNITNTALAAGVGVGLAIGAGYLFPGFMLSPWSAVLAGAVIAGMATAISGLASICVDKYVTNPIIDKVAELCSSTERKYS